MCLLAVARVLVQGNSGIGAKPCFKLHINVEHLLLLQGTDDNDKREENHCSRTFNNFTYEEYCRHVLIIPKKIFVLGVENFRIAK